MTKTTQAEAVFVSSLQPSDHPTGSDIVAAIRRSLQAYGVRGCMAALAAEYGEHPEDAAHRMHWALALVGANAVAAAA